MPLLTGWDYFIALVVLLSVGFGVVRGLVLTVFALAAWIGAFVGTAILTGYVVALSSMQDYPWVVVIILFLTIFLIIRMFGKWLARSLKAIGLGGVDRLLGAGLGIVRAAVFIALAAVAAKFSGLNQQPAWQQALSRPVLEQTLRLLESYQPMSMTGLRQT